MAREKQKFGLDMRGETEVDPNIELKDYSGPFKTRSQVYGFLKRTARQYVFTGPSLQLRHTARL